MRRRQYCAAHADNECTLDHVFRSNLNHLDYTTLVLHRAVVCSSIVLLWCAGAPHFVAVTEALQTHPSRSAMATYRMSAVTIRRAGLV
mmetsp:Transcript_192/g.258  ORF Transcript_192/g.258 Transcript_192/m.258 type:complete len:88 (+) Transcript_192:760-1023(+)